MDIYEIAVTTFPKISFSVSWFKRSNKISKNFFCSRFSRISEFLVRLQTSLIINRTSSLPLFLSMGFDRQFLMAEISGSWMKWGWRRGLLAILHKVMQADWIKLILCSCAESRRWINGLIFHFSAFEDYTFSPPAWFLVLLFMKSLCEDKLARAIALCLMVSSSSYPSMAFRRKVPMSLSISWSRKSL